MNDKGQSDVMKAQEGAVWKWTLGEELPPTSWAKALGRDGFNEDSGLVGGVRPQPMHSCVIAGTVGLMKADRSTTPLHGARL